MNQDEQAKNYYEAARLARLAAMRIRVLDVLKPGDNVQREDVSQEIDQLTALAQVYATLAGIVPQTLTVIDNDVPVASAPEWLEKKVAGQ